MGLFFFLSLLVILFFINDFERENIRNYLNRQKKKTPETGLLLLLHGLLKQFIQEM